VKKYIILSSLFFSISIAIMINMYRTKEIVFIDAVVESVVASTGVKTKKMEEKEKEVEKKIAEYEQGVDEENKVGPTTEIEIEEVVPEAVVSVTNEQFQEASETMEKELIMANGAQEGQVGKGVESNEINESGSDPFSDLVFASSNESSDDGPEQTSFVALAHNTQTVVHGGDLWFRTAEVFNLGGAFVEKNTVFVATAFILDGQVSISVKEIDGIAIGAKRNVIDGSKLSKSKQGYIISDGSSIEIFM
jgi:hypothetical protein